MSQEFSTLIDLTARLDEIPNEGRKYKFAADTETLDFLVQNSSAISIARFEGYVELRSMRGGYEASGKLRAVLEQQCVVTLEPVADELDVQLSRVYLRGVEPEPEVTSNGEVFVDLESSADNEWFEGDKIDLSDLVFEQYLLALDPYPRKQGAKIPEMDMLEESEEPSPFAVLSKLKQSE